MVPTTRGSLIFTAGAVVWLGLWPAIVHAQGSYQVLHAFAGAPADGANPQAGLIQGTCNEDSSSFYGTTRFGGAFDKGSVFRMNPDSSVDVMYSFSGMNGDGANPIGSLVQANDGTFYGTTANGGDFNLGTTFSMGCDGGVNILHSFNLTDGATPIGPLIFGAEGNLYGTTTGGGGTLCNCGTAFVMSGGGVVMLHAFTGTDGSDPFGGLVLGTDGNFYGTTVYGGATSDGTYSSGNGTVYRMDSNGEVTVLYSFTGIGGDRTHPLDALIQAIDGNFYGTTRDGGIGFGTLFESTADGSVTILHTFGTGLGGTNPDAPLLQASDGNFYGSTCEAIFSLTPDGTYTLPHVFTNNDGNSPEHAPLIQASDGALYGTTYTGSGAEFFLGVTFRLTLP